MEQSEIIDTLETYHNLFYLAFDLSIFITLSRPFVNFWHRYPKGIDTPFTLRVASICYLCIGVV